MCPSNRVVNSPDDQTIMVDTGDRRGAEERQALSDYGIKVKRAALGTIGTKREMDLTFKLVGVRK